MPDTIVQWFSVHAGDAMSLDGVRVHALEEEIMCRHLVSHSQAPLLPPVPLLLLTAGLA
jgi:hypothetical protein